MTRQFTSPTVLFQNFVFSGFTPSGEQKVKDALWASYSLSDAVAAYIDQYGRSDGTVTLGTIQYGENRADVDILPMNALWLLSGEHARLLFHQYTLTIDPDYAEQGWMIDPHGNLVRANLTQIITHELAHSLLSYSDPLAVTYEITRGAQYARDWLGDPAADFQGDAVQFENAVGALLSEGYYRNSYFNFLPNEFTGSGKLGVWCNTAANVC